MVWHFVCVLLTLAGVPLKGGKKNPNVDTSFLPDRERERGMQEQREKLKKEWLEEQDKIKSESWFFCFIWLVCWVVELLVGWDWLIVWFVDLVIGLFRGLWIC